MEEVLESLGQEYRGSGEHPGKRISVEGLSGGQVRNASDEFGIREVWKDGIQGSLEE